MNLFQSLSQLMFKRKILKAFPLTRLKKMTTTITIKIFLANEIIFIIWGKIIK